MKLSVKALAGACALIWGAAIMIAALSHLVWPGYAGAFLEFLASIYPGYHAGGSGSVILGTVYGLIDGAGAGALLAWIYNRLAS